MNKLILLIFSVLIPCITFSQEKVSWGWEVHRYINDHAVDYLPGNMSFFLDHRSYLIQHSIDPDTDPLPGYYHYIDIDYYPEFFEGTLPQNMDSLIALYSVSIVQDNGIVPWIVEQWTDSLSTLMARGEWDDVWQVAAELGHYVADAHQPLHLTMNYNGQLTDNYGIHSRYETQLMNMHLSELPLPEGTGLYWPNVIDSVFLYVDKMYSFVDSIMIADDLAYTQDNDYGSIYYNILWQELEQLTTISMQKAILNLASIWRTAWENAGGPSPVSIQSTNRTSESYFLSKAYPNPFNASTTIEFSIPEPEFVTLKLYTSPGREIATLISKDLKPGNYKYIWNASVFASGVYFYRLQLNNGLLQTNKLILLR